MTTEFKSVTPVNIEETMQAAYLEYAMSVIVGRALPDARDGLKPVHRRILYAMSKQNAAYNRPFLKSARIVGEVIGKYHPHGDSAVYDAIVRMVQDFSLRNPLINGQGNFGSIDGDSAAAMRYTEIRLQKISHEFLEDLDKNTVDFLDNYDGSLQEPSVLPTKIPNLLINGSTGIAVGMATNIPPHNLTEVTNALIYYIDRKDSCTLEEILPFIQGPDFPTAGVILGHEGILSAYKTGRGIIRMRARTEVEAIKNSSREAIIVTELPYTVNKARLIEKIAENVKEKKIEGIQDLRDESDRKGMRIVIELKRYENPDTVLANLFKQTAMQSTFGANMLAVVDGQPQVMPLLEIFKCFINHRIDVVVRRIRFELKKAEEKAHILEGLKIAHENIDAVVALIRSSRSGQEAKERLVSEFPLTDIQAQAILDMRLQRLTGLEVDKLLTDLAELHEKIEWYKQVLADNQQVLNIIKDELTEIRDSYGSDRRTEIVEGQDEIMQEDLIPVEEMAVTMSRKGYIKRVVLDTFRAQNRGGKGKIGMTTKEEDILEHIFIASTHDTMLIFTNLGKVYWKRVFELPPASRTAKGRAWVNILPLDEDERVKFCMPISDYDENSYIVMITEKGIIKKTALPAYKNKRTNGTKAILIDDDDRLVEVRLCTDEDLIFIATKRGMALKFASKTLRAQGRVTRGCRGIKLKGGSKDKVISMEVASVDGTILTITEKGYGKKSTIESYRLGSRANMGVMNIRSSDRIGDVVASVIVNEEDEVMLITQKGKIIRLYVDQVRSTGRVTQGVRMINLEADEKVVSVAKIASDSEDIEEGENLDSTQLLPGDSNEGEQVDSAYVPSEDTEPGENLDSMQVPLEDTEDEENIDSTQVAPEDTEKEEPNDGDSE